jgi:hypothetical protein
MTLLSPSLFYVIIAFYLFMLLFAIYSCFKFEKGALGMILCSIAIVFIPVIGMLFYLLYRLIQRHHKQPVLK